jgi:hypothetical protein
VSARGALTGVVGDVALIVDPLSPRSIASGLVEALNPSGRTRRVEAGIRHASRFRWETAGQETLALIEEAVSLSRKV